MGNCVFEISTFNIFRTLFWYKNVIRHFSEAPLHFLKNLYTFFNFNSNIFRKDDATDLKVRFSHEWNVLIECKVLA